MLLDRKTIRIKGRLFVRDIEIFKLFLHLIQQILFLFLLHLFFLSSHLDVTPDLRAKFALHPVSKLIKSNVFFRDLRSNKLNGDINSLTDLNSMTYLFFFFSEVGSIHKDEACILRPRKFSIIDKSPGLLEYFASFEVLSFTKTLCDQL
jgi:hypothetical protein